MSYLIFATAMKQEASPYRAGSEVTKQNKKLNKKLKAISANIEKTSNKLFQNRDEYFNSWAMPSQDENFGYKSGIDEAVHALNNTVFSCIY